MRRFIDVYDKSNMNKFMDIFEDIVKKKDYEQKGE